MNIHTHIVGILQVRAYRTLQAYVQQVLDGYDLNSTQWSILGLIMSATDGMRVMDLAERLGVEAPLVTMLSKPMLKKKLIVKSKSASDNRARILALTPGGKSLAQEIEKVLTKQLQILTRGVTESEMKTYTKVLEAIVKNGTAIHTLSAAEAVVNTKGGV